MSWEGSPLVSPRSVAPCIVVTDHSFKHLQHEQAAAERVGAQFKAYQCASEEETIEAVDNADVVITNFAPMTERVIQTMKPGSAIIRYGIGYDSVDVEAATARGITVVNVPDYGVETVADHAAASILSLCRRLPVYDHAIKTQGWARPGDVGELPSLRNLSVGLIGFGRIASALKDRLVPFGFTILVFDPMIEDSVIQAAGAVPVTLEELAQRSNVVSLHAPSNDVTRGMIDKKFLSALPDSALIINTSRGTLINTADLTEALISGKISGAALDVSDPEPLPLDSPLRTMPNVILTPHAAFFDEQSLDNLQYLASAEAIRFLNGEPVLNPINVPIAIAEEFKVGK